MKQIKSISMTSLVEYHGHGFWCRNSILRDWLRELVETSRKFYPDIEWLKPATLYWEAAMSALRSMRLTIQFQDFIHETEHQEQAEELFAAIAKRSLRAPIKRAAVMGLDLIQGRLPTTQYNSVDYWPGEEWMIE
jgi:hypothetical protein